MATFSQFRSSEHVKFDGDQIGRRFGDIYARRAARSSAELLVGYLHNEDPRYHASAAQGGWKRTRYALLSVVATNDADGGHRAAFVPLAGALGSGMTSIAVDRRPVGVSGALVRSGIVYGRYFATAVFKEFSPDLWSHAPSFVRKYK